jgi:hypothetical protein
MTASSRRLATCDSNSSYAARGHRRAVQQRGCGWAPADKVAAQLSWVMMVLVAM